MRGDGDRFDVLILGGGAAGCVLAARLSEDPARRVCLVEAGSGLRPPRRGRWPPALLDARVDGALTYLRGGGLDPHDWGFDAGLSGIRAKVIGGCSSHNGCEALWGSPADYDAWAAATGDASWGYEAFAPFLARAHATLRARPGAVGGLSAIRRALLGAGERLGLPLLPDLNAPDALRGAGSIPVNAVGTLRWGAAFAYLDPARGRPNLTILADTLVDRVRDRRRARGRGAGGRRRAARVDRRRRGRRDRGLLRHAGDPGPERDRRRRRTPRARHRAGGRPARRRPRPARPPVRAALVGHEATPRGGRRATARPRGPARAVRDQVGVKPVCARVLGHHDRCLERPDLRPARASGRPPRRARAVRDARRLARAGRPALRRPDRPAARSSTDCSTRSGRPRPRGAGGGCRRLPGRRRDPGVALLVRARDRAGARGGWRGTPRMDPRERGRDVSPVRHRADGPRRRPGRRGGRPRPSSRRRRPASSPMRRSSRRSRPPTSTSRSWRWPRRSPSLSAGSTGGVTDAVCGLAANSPARRGGATGTPPAGPGERVPRRRRRSADRSRQGRLESAAGMEHRREPEGARPPTPARDWSARTPAPLGCHPRALRRAHGAASPDTGSRPLPASPRTARSTDSTSVAA